ncbi:MAG: hypothetical protein ABIO39_01040 [Caulobacteraceae bacterium]
MSEANIMTNRLIAALFGAALLAPMAARADMPAETRTVVQQDVDCDRACLYGIADQYMKALVAKDPKAAPFAKTVRFSENFVMMPLGEGAWNTADGVGPSFKLADVKQGQVGWVGTINERGVNAVYSMRLRVKDHQITEVESVVSRKGVTTPYGDVDKYYVPPVITEVVPVAKRRLRDRMVSIADGYFDTLQLNDGVLFTSFTPDCSRRENATWTASDPKPDPNAALSRFGSLTCEEGFTRGNYRWDDRLRERRYPLVDEELGIVLSTVFIDHAGLLQTYDTTDGKTQVAGQKSPHSFAMMELFKIVDGKIRHAEAVFLTVPYRMPTPWIDHPIWPGQR